MGRRHGSPATLARLLYPIWSGVGLRDLALFYRQFAAMINAGVPIYQCLTTLTVQTANPTLRRCIQTISRRVQAGGQLSGAMGEYPVDLSGLPPGHDRRR